MKKDASDVTPEVLQEIIDKWEQFYADDEQHDPVIEHRMLDRLLARQGEGPIEPEDAVHIAAIMKYLRQHGVDVNQPPPPRQHPTLPHGLRSSLAAADDDAPFRAGAVNEIKEDETLDDDTSGASELERLVKTANTLDDLGFSIGADGIDSGLSMMMIQSLLQDKLRELDAVVRGHDKYSAEAEELAGLAQSAPSMDLVKQIQGLTERAMTSKLMHALRAKRGPRGGVQRKQFDDDVLLSY